jgi:hypothetical protein
MPVMPNTGAGIRLIWSAIFAMNGVSVFDALAPRVV